LRGGKAQLCAGKGSRISVSAIYSIRIWFPRIYFSASMIPGNVFMPRYLHTKKNGKLPERSDLSASS
jgi:hypothetical protein